MTYTGRWHPDPDPRQAEHDCPDCAKHLIGECRPCWEARQRQAEEKAREEFPEPVYVGDDECI